MKLGMGHKVSVLYSLSLTKGHEPLKETLKAEQNGCFFMTKQDLEVPHQEVVALLRGRA